MSKIKFFSWQVPVACIYGICRCCSPNEFESLCQLKAWGKLIWHRQSLSNYWGIPCYISHAFAGYRIILVFFVSLLCNGFRERNVSWEERDVGVGSMCVMMERFSDCYLWQIEMPGDSFSVQFSGIYLHKSSLYPNPGYGSFREWLQSPLWVTVWSPLSRDILPRVLLSTPPKTICVIVKMLKLFVNCDSTDCKKIYGMMCTHNLQRNDVIISLLDFVDTVHLHWCGGGW